MPSLKQIAVMDREKRTLLDPWPLQDAQGNTLSGWMKPTIVCS
jgi:hypothetical protein